MEPLEQFSFRAQALVVCFLVLSGASLALMGTGGSGVQAQVLDHRYVTGAAQSRAGQEPSAAALRTESKVAAAPSAPKQIPQAPAAATGPVAQPNIHPYKGLGAWVDLYDFGKPNTMDPASIVNELADRQVRTIYLQTGRWNIPADIAEPGLMNIFIEAAHARRLRVVGWYLPGFGDLALDLQRSLAVVNYTTPSGQRFDGFAPDIEDRRGVGNDPGRFHAAIIDYSRRLRDAVGPSYALGAIVVDAKNNKRAPASWAGFPWPEIGQLYDVVLPMAYWTVVKRKVDCPSTVDSAAYMREVIAETEALMGTKKPLHPIGGIADCNTPEEIAAFTSVSIELGAVGGSIYDFWTTHTHGGRDAIWGELSRFNRLLPVTYERS